MTFGGWWSAGRRRDVAAVVAETRLGRHVGGSAGGGDDSTNAGVETRAIEFGVGGPGRVGRRRRDVSAAAGAPREAFQRTTAILDESFRRDSAYGAALRVAFDCTRQLGGDKEILYAYEPLTLERSVEWRYHEPTTSEARDALSSKTLGAQSARYTMVLLDGETFLNMIEGECEGLKKMVETFRASRRDARRDTRCV